MKMSGRDLVGGAALVCFALLSLAVGEIWAVRPFAPVTPDPMLESWRWRSYPELRGMGLRCMAEDSDGNMWFGVNDGVVRYDGVTWTTFTPQDGLLGAPVHCLCATQDGSVYAGTEMGISRFSNEEWRRALPIEGGPLLPVSDLLEASDGSVWAGTSWGALRLHRQGAVLYTTGKTQAWLQKQMPGVKLIRVPDGVAPGHPWGEGLGVLVACASESDQPTGYPKPIKQLHPDGPGSAAGLRAGDQIAEVDGLALVSQEDLDGPSGTEVTLTVHRADRQKPLKVDVVRAQVGGDYADFWVHDVYEDRDGTMWFGLQNGEVVRAHIREGDARQAEGWRLYTADDGLLAGRKPRITQSRDGSIWTVSANVEAGVNRFDGVMWAHVSLRGMGGLMDVHASLLATADGSLWVGGQWGSLGVYRDGAWTVYKASPLPIPTGRIIGLLETADGALWMAGFGQEAVRVDLGTSRWATYEGLRFFCDTPDGTLWFVASDSAVVSRNGESWLRYGPEDGLMNCPGGLIATGKGEVWAVGSQDSATATCRFDGQRWSLRTHPRFHRTAVAASAYAASDGALWVGAVAGALRIDGEARTHYAPPEAPEPIYCIGEGPDGSLWFGGKGLSRFDGRTWTPITEPKEAASWVHTIYGTGKGDIWVVLRSNGVLRLSDGKWTRYDVRDGLADNRVSYSGLFQTADGSVWVTTGEGVSRFDGQVWTTQALPTDLRGVLRQSADGALWVYGDGRAIRCAPDTAPPETEMTVSVDEVSQPGNTTLAWTGVDPWHDTSAGELQYAWRLDGGAWSAFSREKSHVFERLLSGEHVFEVKARDRDFNEDPAPAVVHFTVLLPVWEEPWFIALMAVLMGVIGLQTGRAVRRGRWLQEANVALSAANEELSQANKALTRERAVERIQTLVQAMEQASDFEMVLSLLIDGMRDVGLHFDTCGIDVLDEPVEAPTMAYFEAHGFCYATYAIDPQGNVSRESYRVAAPFPGVLRGAVERFVAGEIWQGRYMDLGAMVEMPIAHYGRLRMTALDRANFADDEVAALQEFADAIGLGYIRYLDFQLLEEQNRALMTANRQIQEQNRQIREQTERKSRFLANMSHELRTPMNAIKGFTNLVLRHEGDRLSERHRENLGKVLVGADRLLALINDLLDLSKVASGRMDVTPQRFDIKRLIVGCCAELEPLVRPEVKLICDVSDDVGEAHTDPGKLRQIVTNLLGNALKFTEQGAVAVRISREEDVVVIAVADTGVGMPSDALDTIFEEFQQVKGSSTRHKGTGLGLSITKQFAELLGGSIRVESEMGKGSTFTVRVPGIYEGS